METFTPIAMRCTQEQFDAVKPKLEHLNIMSIDPFTNCNYLVNNLGEKTKLISNVMDSSKIKCNREVHEEWNEEKFLKACGIKIETLQEKEQRLLKELEEVKKQIEEESTVKIGDWVYNIYEKSFYEIGFRPLTTEAEINQCKKITNPELIKLLEQEIK